MVTKIESGYDLAPKEIASKISFGGIRCDSCYFWSEPNKCDVVKGNIEPDACCNLYSYNDKINLNYISGQDATYLLTQEKIKLSKEQAGYLCPLPKNLRSDKEKSFGCHTCNYFVPNSRNTKIGSCGIVKGLISKYACCNLYSYDPLEFPLKYANGEFIRSKFPDIEDLYCNDNQ